MARMYMRKEQWLAWRVLHYVEELQDAGGVGRGNLRIDIETLRGDLERYSTFMRESKLEK